MLNKSVFVGCFLLCLLSLGIVFAETSAVVGREVIAGSPVWTEDQAIQRNKLIECHWMPLRFKPQLFGVYKWVYDQSLPQSIVMDLEYTDYLFNRVFGVALKEAVYIREKPDFNSKILSKKPIHTKLNLIGAVYGQYMEKWQTDTWYQVSYLNGSENATGYVFSGYLTKREFNYRAMQNAAIALETATQNRQTGHIDNYKNRNGRAPKYDNKDLDSLGNMRDQSAPAYTKPDVTSDFRYLSDGRLLVIEETLEAFYKCIHPHFSDPVYIPKKYVVVHEDPRPLTQLIIVDRGNQTELAMEKRGEDWIIVSQNLVTTGEKAQYKDETELGVFYVIEKKSKFIYLDDVTKEVDGYAPYALRFNGGAYTHGVPVNFKKVMELVIKTPEVKDAMGVIIQPAVLEEKVKEMVDPGMIEYLSTIGTIPRSHKCVRHHTSSALFLYNWVRIGDAALIVIE